MENLTKICNSCGESKTLDWFYFRLDTGKLRASCKKCVTEKKGYKCFKVRLEKMQLLFQQGLQECKKCLKVKHLYEFDTNNGSKTKKTNKCKECVATYYK